MNCLRCQRRRRRRRRTNRKRRSAPCSAMSSRIVVFPVMGRRWAFTTVLPTAGAESGTGNSAAALSWRDLWKTVRATPSTSERADLVTNFASDKVILQYSSCQIFVEQSLRKCEILSSAGFRFLAMNKNSPRPLQLPMWLSALSSSRSGAFELQDSLFLNSHNPRSKGWILIHAQNVPKWHLLCRCLIRDG